jgi:hypothetical protein
MSFLLGCVVTSAAIVLMGASFSSTDSHRYDADFDTIMGGLGGLTIEVTDHQNEKAYLYVIPSKGKEKEDAAAPQLVATVDLKSAGKPKLDATMVKFEKERNTSSVTER